jgi:hypothetical protein
MPDASLYQEYFDFKEVAFRGILAYQVLFRVIFEAEGVTGYPFIRYFWQGAT